MPRSQKILDVIRGRSGDSLRDRTAGSCVCIASFVDASGPRVEFHELLQEVAYGEPDGGGHAC